jgi:hypothetical protein
MLAIGIVGAVYAVGFVGALGWLNVAAIRDSRRRRGV